MNNRVSSLSFISDRTIGTKVSAGFAVVLLILAVSSALAWLAFGRTSGAVADYTRLVVNSGIFCTSSGKSEAGNRRRRPSVRARPPTVNFFILEKG